ncbi:MAG: efflux transporter outer membrane subunit [Thermodesulfobacteriota bacterium]
MYVSGRHRILSASTKSLSGPLFVLVSVLIAGSGCAAVGSAYRRPDISVPAAWHGVRAGDNTATAQRTEDLSAWWVRLGDPILTGLIEQALAGSTELRIARAKLREARARRDLAGADYFPAVKASASAGRSKNSTETGSGGKGKLYQAGFDASWEPDIFGGNRRGVEAAQADLESSEAALRSTQVSLAAEVALNYVEARSLQARLDIARKNLSSQSETVRLTDWRAQAGLVTSLDVEQSRANLEQTRAGIPTLSASLAEAENRLAILLGRTPGAVHERLAAPAPVPAVPEGIAIGIPADTLVQRPDVQAAERKLAAETARVGQAKAARYPGLTLSGSIGLEALTLGGLNASGAVTRSLLASVAGVIFDGGRLRSQVEIQSAIQEQAMIQYEAAVLAALEDVEDALVSLTEIRRREEALRDAVEAARNAASLARHRYTGGLIDFQTVLETGRTVLTVEDSLASAEADRASALIRLYKALGGGWATKDSGNSAGIADGGKS